VKPTSDAPVKILVADFIAPFNKGELAILDGILKSFETLGETEVTIFSIDPKIDRERFMQSLRILDVGDSLYLRPRSLYPQSLVRGLWDSYFAVLQHLLFTFLYGTLGKNALRIMHKPLWKAYCACDVIITCFDEIDLVNGSFLKNSPLYIAMLAKTLRKPVVIYANGTTRISSEFWIWRLHSGRLWRILARYLLLIVDLITIRDEGTYHYFKKISRDKVPMYLTADPAFLISAAPPDRVKKIMQNEKIQKENGPLIGVEMAYDVLVEAYGNEPNRTGIYHKAVREIAEVLDRLIERFGSTIVFVPHSIEPYPYPRYPYHYRDDRIVAKDICSLMLNRHMTRPITNEYSPEELKGILGQLDLFISCRVHPIIAALSLGTPSCLIRRERWDERAYNIIGKMLKQEKWIYSVENLNADSLFALASKLFFASSEIRQNLPSIYNAVREKAVLNGKLLKAMLDERGRSSKKLDILTQEC